MSRTFARYVAIGDSTTEGLDDPDGHGGYRGWADRLAEKLAALQGEVLYANLAVRGLESHEILESQLGRALAMEPALATVVAGVNDLLRPGFDVERFGRTMVAMQRPLVAQGAVVLTFTLPDLTRVMPVARLLRGRVAAMNQAVRDASREAGATLVDIARHEVAGDPRLWSDDRLHANGEGHARIADALAHGLGLPGSSDAWTHPLPPMTPPTLRQRVEAERIWARGHLVPWLGRHARGASSGDGRVAKRPELQPLTAAERR